MTFRNLLILVACASVVWGSPPKAKKGRAEAAPALERAVSPEK